MPRMFVRIGLDILFLSIFPSLSFSLWFDVIVTVMVKSPQQQLAKTKLRHPFAHFVRHRPKRMRPDCHYLFLHASACSIRFSHCLYLAALYVPSHCIYSLLVYCSVPFVAQGNCCCRFLSRSPLAHVSFNSHSTPFNSLLWELFYLFLFASRSWILRLSLSLPKTVKFAQLEPMAAESTYVRTFVRTSKDALLNIAKDGCVVK